MHLSFAHHDLVTPDGYIVKLSALIENKREAVVRIEKISPSFAGFRLDPQCLFFNFKSTLAQLGLNGVGKELSLDPKTNSAEIRVELTAYGEVAREMLKLLSEGAYIGKLFAKDPDRLVKNPDYLLRLFGRADREGKPLLSLGGLQGSDQLTLENVGGRTIAYLSLQEGTLGYDKTILGFLPVLNRTLANPEINTRAILQPQQQWLPQTRRILAEQNILLVRTAPLHIRTMFGHVAEDLLPQGFKHTTASILDPTTAASGDVYELYGSSSKEINDIPLEFYTLEPYRQYLFFSDKEGLQSALEDEKLIFHAFETAPQPRELHTAAFIVTEEELRTLQPEDWIYREPIKSEFPGLIHPGRQVQMVERYIHQQPSYPFLKGIEEGWITSEGVLFVRYFPSPLMKEMLLGRPVERNLKRIYFRYPSFSCGDYFSHEDRSMLLDLAKFAISVFWADETTGKVLQYVPKPEKDSGMFVPLAQVDDFLKAASFGIYGSTLMSDSFEESLKELFNGLKKLRETTDHPLFNKNTPIALITGGGPGVMEVGNRVAKSLGLISCANIVDFRTKPESFVIEQEPNPYIEAKMTFRLDRLVERQAEFNLDFPIFLMGGIGTDFEYALEEVRRKVGASTPTPVLLFGKPDYWRQKITSRFQCNLATGTIAGSEWVSNCFYCVQNGKEALEVYRRYFAGTLPLGKKGPVYKDGFTILPAP